MFSFERAHLMAPVVTCPRCGQRVDSTVRECPYCGVDFALAAILASENELDQAGYTAGQAPITPEVFVPRLGDILLERKLISPQDLQRALDQHKQLTLEKKPRRLGQVIIQLGLIDQETLDEIVTGQIFQLQAALQRSNEQLEKRVQERTQDLQQALSKLSELNQLKSNFISNISHELRTPLTHIKGYLDLMADGGLGALTEEQKTAVNVLQRAEARLEQLIEDLIRFSIAARGEFTLHKELHTPRELIQATSERATHQALSKNIQLDISVHDGVPPVNVDSEKITWVLYQLMDNAVKFTPSGGKVLVVVEKDGRDAKFSIIDSGIGIPEDKMEEIFEPFHQLDGSESRRYGGTGLGLALVKSIIEAHGAFIKVQSVVGMGSCFSFILQGAIHESL
jgi:signal transduction histidine kinase